MLQARPDPHSYSILKEYYSTFTEILCDFISKNGFCNPDGISDSLIIEATQKIKAIINVWATHSVPFMESAKQNRKRNWHLLCISSRDILLLYLLILFLIYDVGGVL